MSYLGIALVLSAAIYLPFAIWIAVTEAPTIDVWGLIAILGSTILHLGYFLLLQSGYRHGDLSLVYPIARAAWPLLATCFAVLFLNEVVSLQWVAAAMIIVIGIVMLTGGVHRKGDRVSASVLSDWALER